MCGALFGPVGGSFLGVGPIIGVAAGMLTGILFGSVACGSLQRKFVDADLAYKQATDQLHAAEAEAQELAEDSTLEAYAHVFL